jgi:ATP-binding cassette subfamily F protein uup
MLIGEDKRIIEIVRDIAEHIPLANGTSMTAATLLTRFNFPPNVQFSYAHTLSGGEKRRLFLLTVLMKNPNFLILDEPTNDLDIVTLQTLEDFLEEFKGCVLIVSHDRYFIDRLVDHTFVMEGNGTIKDFPGNYTEYREWKANQKGEEFPVLKIEEPVIEKKAVEKTVTETPAKKLSYKTQRELELIEAALPKLEEKKLELETKLASGLSEYNEIQKISEELKSIANELDEKSTRWLEIQEEA